MVEQKRTKAAKIGVKRRRMPPRISAGELAKLGGGKIAYIKMLSSDEANRMYPAVKGLPKGISLFALHAADGTPLALTDSRQAAIGHAMGDKLHIESLH